MKKLILLMVMAAGILSVHSQNSRNDSTLLPNSQLRKALQKIELGKQCAEDLRLQQLENSILYDKIAVKDSLIYAYLHNKETMNALILNYEAMEGVSKTQDAIDKSTIQTLQSDIRKLKLKAVFTGIGALAIGVLTVIILK